MLRIEDALEVILDKIPLLGIERVELPEAASRILREEAVCDLNLPPFDRSRMDGYALIASDTVGASSAGAVKLREVGESSAGHAFTGRINRGEAVKIMTGAPVPAGADAVQKIEVIRAAGDGWIEIDEEAKPGQFITPLGIEAKSGDLIMKSGEVITPAVAAALASFGYARVNVSAKPRVVILSTGDELVEVEEKPGPSQIRNSNTYSLAGYSQRAGAEVIAYGIVPDDLLVTREAVEEAVSAADVVILSGGVSMGDYDLVKPALLELGAQVWVEKVAMHPGKPTVFATIGDKVIFGLPGNPVSVAVSFNLFVRPALRKMQAANIINLQRVKAYLNGSVKGAPPRRSHQPALLTIKDGRAEVKPLKWSGSSDLVAFMHANALIVVSEERQSMNSGELVEVISLIDYV